MPSLLDTVKQNSTALSAPTPASNPLLSASGLQPTVGENTQGTAQIAAVGQTGKLQNQGGLNTRLSSLGERLASVQALNQAKEVTQEAQLQGVSLDQQADALQQQFNQQNTQISENRVAAQENFNTQLKGVLQDYSNQLKGLNLAKDKARMEQVGFMLRMGNQEYLDKLQVEGRKARLDNDLAFNEALQRSVFADEMDLFSDSLDFRNLMMADSRTFQQQMGTMDIEFAMQIAMADNKAASSQMMWSGIGTAAGAGLSYAAGQMGSKGSIVGANASTAVPVQAGPGEASLTNPFPQFNQPSAPAYVAPGGGSATGTVPAAPYSLSEGAGPLMGGE